MTVRERLTRGDFNTMHQENIDIGVVRITMTKRGDSHTCILVVRNLYQVDEVVVSEQTI